MLRHLFLLTCMFLGLAAPSWSAAPDDAPVCVVPTGRSIECGSDTRLRLSPDAAPVTLSRTVMIAGPPGPSDPPLMVRVTALASSEIRWNGRVIGRNGVPASSAAGESPGRLVFTAIVPGDAIRPGANRLDIRMSSQRLILPVAQPVHGVRVGPLEDALAAQMRHYLPALALGAALLLIAAGFGVAFARDNSQRGAGLLAAAAALVVLQLGLETARAFVSYPYPWHLPRLMLIAGLAATAGILLARYAAWRFAPRWQRRATWIAALGSGLMLLVAPAFDFKTIGCLCVALIVITACSIQGVRTGSRTAWAALAATALTAGLIVVQQGAFLDRGYYLALTAVFAALLFEQVRPALQRAQPQTPPEIDPPGDASPIRPSDLLVINGRSRRLAPLASVRAIHAADDYCEVQLTDGRRLLHTASLTRLLEDCPPAIVRVHRSHAVNLDLVTGVETGEALRLLLDGGRPIPVGRTYRAEIERRLALRGL